MNFYQTIYAVSFVSQQSHRTSAEDDQAPLHAAHARRSQQSVTLGLRFNQGKEGVSLPVGLIVYELLSCFSVATALAAEAVIRGKTVSAQIMTVISWRTFPIVYLFQMLGFNAALNVVSIHVGYGASDNISRREVGLLVYIESCVCLACLYSATPQYIYIYIYIYVYSYTASEPK